MMVFYLFVDLSKEELDIYKYNYPWDVTLCGNTSIQQYSEDYTIDLSRYATKENNAVLDQHIKYGRQSETLVRIYFTIITIDGTESIYNKTKAYINPKDNPFLRVLRNINDLFFQNHLMNLCYYYLIGIYLLPLLPLPLHHH